MKSLITAIRTLTILPVPGKDTDRMETTLPWFPFIGLLLGGILYGLVWCWESVLPGSWPEAEAALILIGGTILTRGLHLDGFSDFIDGFGGGHTRDRVLEIMKDSAVGAFGAIGLVCVLLLKWIFLVKLIESGAVIWVMPAYIISRTMQVALAVENPYARSEAGTAVSFVSGAKPAHSYAATLAAVCLLLGLSGTSPVWVAVLVICRVVTLLFGWYCRKRIGGVTGDLLGACSEINETLVLLLGCLYILL